MLGLVLLMFGCENQPETVNLQTAVKIGVIAPLSGDNAAWGRSGMLGIETALQIGVQKGRSPMVTIVKEDDRNDPELAKLAFKKLVETDQVSAILALSGSRSMLAIAEQADRFKTPVIALVSSHPFITDNDWVSQFVFDDVVQGTVAALYVIDELLIERVTIGIDTAEPHSQFLADQFLHQFKQAGGMAELIDLSGERRDYETIALGLQKKALDFIYLPVDAERVVAFLQSARRISWNPQVMVSDGLLALMMLEYKDQADLLEGMLSTDIFTTEMAPTEYGRKVQKKYNEMFDSPGTTITVLGCEGTSALLEVLVSCGKKADRDCINEKLRSGNEFEGMLGSILLHPDGKAERPVFINRIKNGKLKPVLSVY